MFQGNGLDEWIRVGSDRLGTSKHRFERLAANSPLHAEFIAMPEAAPDHIHNEAQGYIESLRDAGGTLFHMPRNDWAFVQAPEQEATEALRNLATLAHLLQPDRHDPGSIDHSDSDDAFRLLANHYVTTFGYPGRWAPITSFCTSAQAFAQAADPRVFGAKLAFGDLYVSVHEAICEGELHAKRWREFNIESSRAPEEGEPSSPKQQTAKRGVSKRVAHERVEKYIAEKISAGVLLDSRELNRDAIAKAVGVSAGNVSSADAYVKLAAARSSHKRASDPLLEAVQKGDVDQAKRIQKQREQSSSRHSS